MYEPTVTTWRKEDHSCQRGVGDAAAPMNQGDVMAFHAESGWWRKAAAIAVLPFAALGVAGCDNAETGGEEVEEVAPAEEEVEEG